MPVTVVVGCQWGDEGKGKVVDHMAKNMDWVCRYQGGANAGHTVVTGNKTYILHLVPSGILHSRPRCVIGNGVVIDPAYLLEELDTLTASGIDLEGRFHISESAHVLFPYHKWLESLGGHDVRVGTTRRGVGPAYQDKVARTGIRVYEMMDHDRLATRLEEHGKHLATAFRGAGIEPPQPIDAAVSEWLSTFTGLAHRIRPFVADTVEMLLDALDRGDKILCEGAQGTFLDVDLGTYPFVTSSTTTSSGAAFGLGLPASSLRKVVGICKAYATRVGEGPFPTELSGAAAEHLREKGGEFGATTGRPRRVGWLDLPQLRHAVRINGMTSLVFTKLDVLSGEAKIPICTRYEGAGGNRSCPPQDSQAWASLEPFYEEMPGWEEDISKVRRFADLPSTARRYVERVQDEVGCRIQTVSVGSSRKAVFSVPAATRA